MFFYFDEQPDTETPQAAIYTIEQLRTTGPDEYRAVPTGRYVETRNGKRKELTEGREYKKTGAGRFEKSEWISHMEKAVRQEGKTQLLKDIISHVTAHCAWLHTAEDRREYAIECLSSDAYMYWKDFKAEDRR